MYSGGRGGIRTHEGLAPLAVFKTAALNHSATLPCERYQCLSDIPNENVLATLQPLDPTWTQWVHRVFSPSTPLARAQMTAAALVSAFLVRLA
jgi:hypothetical protein